MPGRIAVVLLALAALAPSLIVAPTGAVADERDAWAALVNGGHVALVRHGSAPPGYGDPPGFKIDDCATQRNMDERGRAQARALGEAFRQHGVPVDKILSSPWCRCLETARLMALGPVESVMAVASSERSPERLVVLKQMVADWRGPGTLVLVTHALTVRALVGIMPEQAEIVVIRPRLGDQAGMDVVGRISAPRVNACRLPRYEPTTFCMPRRLDGATLPYLWSTGGHFFGSFDPTNAYPHRGRRLHASVVGITSTRRSRDHTASVGAVGSARTEWNGRLPGHTKCVE